MENSPTVLRRNTRAPDYSTGLTILNTVWAPLMQLLPLEAVHSVANPFGQSNHRFLAWQKGACR
jgi:hypothetical protein